MEYKRKVPWLKVIPIQTEITRMCAKVHRQNLENQEKSAHYKCQLMIDTNKFQLKINHKIIWILVWNEFNIFPLNYWMHTQLIEKQ